MLPNLDAARQRVRSAWARRSRSPRLEAIREAPPCPSYNCRARRRKKGRLPVRRRPFFSLRQAALPGGFQYPAHLFTGELVAFVAEVADRLGVGRLLFIDDALHLLGAQAHD